MRSVRPSGRSAQPPVRIDRRSIVTRIEHNGVAGSGHDALEQPGTRRRTGRVRSENAVAPRSDAVKFEGAPTIADPLLGGMPREDRLAGGSAVSQPILAVLPGLGDARLEPVAPF